MCKICNLWNTENYQKYLKALKDRKACLIANHGQIAFEDNLSKAFELAQEVENISFSI